MSWRPEAIAELIRLGRAGESFEAVGKAICPHKANPDRIVAVTWTRYASDDDKRVRREALKARGFNRPKQYRNRGIPVGEIFHLEPALTVEGVDPWAGMGMCFGV